MAEYNLKTYFLQPNPALLPSTTLRYGGYKTAFTQSKFTILPQAQVDLFKSSFSLHFLLQPNNGLPATPFAVFGFQVSTTNAVRCSWGSTGQIQFEYRSNNVAGSVATNVAGGLFTSGAVLKPFIVSVVGDSTINGAGGMKIYINGQPVAISSTVTGTTTGVVFSALQTSDMYWGCRNNNGVADLFGDHAIAEDVWMYDYAMTQSEVLSTVTAKYNSYSTTKIGLLFGTGQSNLNGGAPNSTLPANLSGALFDLFIYNKASNTSADDGRFRALHVGVNNRTVDAQTFYGFDVFLADKLSQQRKMPVAYIKYAVDGTSQIAGLDSTGDWSVTSVNELNDKFKNWYVTPGVAKLLAAATFYGLTIDFIEVIRSQGEADCNDQTKSLAFEAEFSNMLGDQVAHIGASLGVPATDIRYTFLKMPSWLNRPFRSNVVTGQTNVSTQRNGKNVLLSTDLASTDDNVHLNLAGCEYVADAMIAQWQGNVPTPAIPAAGGLTLFVNNSVIRIPAGAGGKIDFSIQIKNF